MAHEDNDTFSGTWLYTHWYPTKDDSAEEKSEHTMRAYQRGEELVLESTDKDESYMLVRLKVENNIASGSWHESTKPSGDFEGAEYSGAGQLIVDAETGAMDGVWAGAGYDHKLGKMRIYTDKWQIVRLSE